MLSFCCCSSHKIRLQNGSHASSPKRSLGMKGHATSSGIATASMVTSPWQNGFAERLIGSIRRECLDHLVILSEAHLRRILQTYATQSGRTGHWTKMPGLFALFSGSETSRQTLSSAGFTTFMSGFRFSVHTTWSNTEDRTPLLQA